MATCRLNPPLMPRISSFNCSSPSTLTVMTVCPGPRPAIRCSRRDDAVGEKSVGGKMQYREPAPARDDGVENFVDVGPQEDFAAGQIHPRDVWIPPDEGDHFVGGELVGRLTLPDVAGLAAILTPVRQAEVQFQRRTRTDGRGSEKRGTGVCRSSERIGKASCTPHHL